jgi:hypothetical protein
LLKKTVAKFEEIGCRPTFKEYEAAEKELLNLPTDPKPKLKSIPHAYPSGYEDGKAIHIRPEFDAQRDLPKGWGLYYMADSGPSYHVLNAAGILWTHIWNCW